MRRRLYLAAATAAVLTAGLLTGPAVVSAQTAETNFEVYVGELTTAQVAKLPAAAGIDLHDTALTRTTGGRIG
ncbi:MAG TPA: hypothetical protein VHJ83_17465, partial [Micromonosporaceae bacterium]|nr:hypothetical protein [Micromonosporaceae bacterium]